MIKTELLLLHTIIIIIIYIHEHFYTCDGLLYVSKSKNTYKHSLGQK